MLEKILTIFLAISISSVAIAAPRMALDGQSIDFGEVAANETLVREVRIGNSGDAPLSVSRVKACCGAKAILEDLLIQTGTSSLLRVELTPGALPGPFRKTITLFSDDPQNPVLIIPLTGTVKHFVPSEKEGRVVLVSDSVPESDAKAASSAASIDISLPVVLFAGFVDGFNPCDFSIVIVLAGILAVGRSALISGLFS